MRVSHTSSSVNFVLELNVIDVLVFTLVDVSV